MLAEEPRAQEPRSPFSSSPCRQDNVLPTLSTPCVAQGDAVVPVGCDGRQLRRDVRRRERSRLPARRAGTSRETSSCRARRRRPASGRTFRATSAASGGSGYEYGHKTEISVCQEKKKHLEIIYMDWGVPTNAKAGKPLQNHPFWLKMAVESAGTSGYGTTRCRREGASIPLIAGTETLPTRPHYPRGHTHAFHADLGYRCRGRNSLQAGKTAGP